MKATAKGHETVDHHGTVLEGQVIKTGNGRGGRLKVRREETGEPSVKVIHENPLRVGKDEMNLVEHPFAALWQKEPGNSVIFYEWETRHPVSGKLLPASWVVAGHPTHGLPNASDERVYLVLMELTREAGFSQTVNFSRYDIVTRLGWPINATSYKMLEGALNRLKGVVINANNAFWNPKAKAYVNTAFNILDHFVINAEKPGRKSSQGRELPISFWKWSDVMFESFQSGYIRTLDLDFALALNSDIALRLYRYLDKKAYDGREEFEIDLFSLCIGHLGMKPSPYPSKLKERLQPAHDELIAKGFLREVVYAPGRAKKSVKARYSFRKKGAGKGAAIGTRAPLTLEMGQQTLQMLEAASPASPKSTQAIVPTPLPEPEREPEITGNGLIEALNDDLSDEERVSLRRMAEIRVSPDVARELLRTVPLEAIVQQLEALSDRKPKDPAAIFVKSCREMWALPESYVARTEAAERAQRDREDAETQEAARARQKAAERQERALQEQEAAHLDAMWEKLDPKARERLDEEAKKRLGPLAQAGLLRGGEIPSGALSAMRRNVMREVLGLSQ